MLSASSILQQIHRNDEAFSFFVSVAEKGESQGGWENERIAALTKDDNLRPKILRHGEDELRHGRLFASLLKRRNLSMTPVPANADYCMLLEVRGIGLSHARLGENRPLSDDEILVYLAHSRVTEQRASEEVDLMVSVFDKDPEIGPALRMIAKDEVNHLAYCHEELLRLRAPRLSALLEKYAKAELEVYRDVSLDFIRRMGEILAWSGLKRGLMKSGVMAKYRYEKWYGWRRMVSLKTPAIANAMAPQSEASTS
ncbi:MAG: ferritin-like domain-containing protein [Planctomycetota bacterium]